MYNKATKKKVKFKFYCTELKILNNNYMNSVGFADKLQNSYNLQHWMRKRKWWWELFIWGLVEIILNAYLLYKTDHLIIWCKKKDELLSHYKSRK